MPDTKSSVEYKLIAGHYGDRVAKRSQVPLINHINEGLVVLDSISATDQAKRAFCLHPIVQSDDELKANYPMVASTCDAWVVMLAMEYRSVANEYLSDKINTEQKIRLSPLFEVNEMLIADKVQNYKDFITYHQGTHPRSDELTAYFEKWISALGVDKPMFEKLCKMI